MVQESGKTKMIQHLARAHLARWLSFCCNKAVTSGQKGWGSPLGPLLQGHEPYPWGLYPRACLHIPAHRGVGFSIEVWGRTHLFRPYQVLLVLLPSSLFHRPGHKVSEIRQLAWSLRACAQVSFKLRWRPSGAGYLLLRNYWALPPSLLPSPVPQAHVGSGSTDVFPRLFPGLQFTDRRDPMWAVKGGSQRLGASCQVQLVRPPFRRHLLLCFELFLETHQLRQRSVPFG